MRALSTLLKNLFRRGPLDRDLDQELQACLDLLIEENLAAGMTDPEARRAARLALGGPEQIKEAVRDIRLGAGIAQFARDLSFAARLFRKSPGFTLIAVFVLALGFGVSGALFSLCDLLLRNPYRFPQSERLVDLQAIHSSGRNSSTGYADFLDWRDQNSSFDSMAIEPWISSVTVTGSGDPRRAFACQTTAGFFPLIGIQPALGRPFSPAEDQPGAPPVLLLSAHTWHRDFGDEPAVTGRAITINDVPHAILGVMPASFRFPGMLRCDYWLPLRANAGAGRNQHQYGVWARLKSGVTLQRAQADMSTIAARLEQAYPGTNRGWLVRVRPLASVLAEQVQTPLAILGAAIGFVLLLACVNVAGLLLARGSARSGEMAIRASLGADRSRLLRQALAESLLLGLISGSLALLVAWATQQALASAPPTSTMLGGSLQLNLTTAAFTLLLALTASLAFGLIPALHSARIDWNARLKGGSIPSGSRTRWLSALVLAETALSLVLLSGVGLLAGGLYTALTLDLGLKAQQVLTFGVDLPDKRYPQDRALRFFDDLLERLRHSPGTVAAGAVGTLPMTGGFSGSGFEIEGRAAPADWMELTTQINEATPDYFAAMGIPLLHGRPFLTDDTTAAARVVAIDQAFVREYLPKGDPIGRRIRTTRGEWSTIIAVVGDIRSQKPSHPAVPMIYRPHTQAGGVRWVVVRSTQDSASLAAAARRAVAELDPAVPILRLRTMREVVDDSLQFERLLTTAGLASAAFALLLSALAVFGLTAYSAARRRHEIGVRIALGASRAQILRLVAGQGVKLAFFGAVLGLPLAFVTGKLLASELEWIRTAGLATLAAAAFVLLFAALLAGLLPAWFAARLQPASTLRRE